MIAPDTSENGGSDRIAEASDWFARMRGPGAAAAREAFETWNADPDNARAYDEIAAIWELSAGSKLRAGLLKPAPSQRPWRRPAPIAAGLAAALALGLVVVGYPGIGGRERAQTFESPPGALRTLALSDGSTIVLDSASRIRTDFAGGERRVILQAGRARFTVAHDAVRPFVVLAGDRAVVARGTVFDVRLTGGLAEVVLIEGAVDLERRAGNTRPALIGRLVPGQSATLTAGGGPPRIDEASPEAWPKGILSGESIRLGDVVSRANRAGGTRIVLADADLADLRVSGGLRPTDPAALGASLAAAFDLSIERNKNGAIILSRTARTPAVAPHPCGGSTCPSS